MRIQHNILAMNAYRNYNTNTSALAKNLEKLSSGYKINRAGDDAAGLAISEKMRAQITGLNAAQKNVKDGISLVKTAEGAMQEIQDMLNRMEYLATQSANGTYDNTVDRTNLQKEVEALKSEINRIADSANFNGINLLDGKTAKAESISALGGLLSDKNIDGTDPTAGGKALVTVSMSGAAGNTPPLTAVEASDDAAETFDGQAASAATADVLVFTTNGNDTEFGGFTFSTAKTVDDIQNTLGGKYTISVSGGKTGATNLADGDVITLTAITKGTSGLSANDVTNAKGQVDFTAGINEGDGTAETSATYTFELDVNELEGGQIISLGGKDLLISNANNGTTTSGKFEISGIDATDAGGTMASDLETALDVFSDFNAKVTYDTGTGKATVTLTAKTPGAAGNKGELEVSTTDGKTPVGNIVHTVGQDAQPGTPGKQAQATFKSADLELENLKKVGTQFKFGNTTYEVVADNATNLSANQIKTGEIDADKINELLQKEIVEPASTGNHKLNAKYTDGQIVLTGTESKAGTVEALKGQTIEVANAPAAGTKAGNAATDWKGLEIEVGKTTLDDLKNHEIELDNGDTVKLGDLFDIKATNATAAISANSVITFEAKQTGELSDKVMSAITYDKDAASEVRDGWDEGQTGAGNNTHYELAIDTSSDKLAGGASFSFGTGSNIKTFDISYDGKVTGNGSIGTGKDEVGAGRVTIDLSSSMTADQKAEAIKKAVSDAMGGFNVKTTVTGNSIKLEADAATATPDTNYGGVRFSSAGGAFSGGVYKAYNAFDGGTEGTYAQVGYEFDPSKLKAGDKVTIGGTTITVGEKDSTVKNDDGTVSITIAESKAQDADELISAFESAGFQSGQLEIEDGVLTITGQQTGQTAEDLAKAMGVSVTSSRVLTTGGLTFQIGATADSFNQMTVSIGDMHTEAMGIADLDISLQDGAKDAIQTIKDAINYVSSVRGDLGATQNRLEHTANNLSVMAENIQDAESTIRDTDVAEEMMAYTKNNILIQSAQAMLAQANAVPQGVLQLLG